MGDRRVAQATLGEEPGRRGAGRALAIVVAAQLLAVLDASVVNIALPSAQADLGMADANRQWVVTAYSLAFGGLLMLGGRVGDVRGRKKTFLAGLAGFTLASAAAGAAPNEAVLIAARAAQGVAAAFLAPVGLAIITTVFPTGRERARAFAVFGAVTGSGGVLGMILGGLLTSLGSWRWCLLFAVPLGLAVLVLALRWLPESTAERPGGFDVPGALLVTAGSGSLIFGVTRIPADGWASVTSLGCVLVGVVLLALFVRVERGSAAPMMPVPLVRDRVRGGAFAVILLVNAAAAGFYLLLTFYLQGVRGFSALATGVAFVPVGVGIFVGSAVAGRLQRTWQPRGVTVLGLVAAVTAMAALGLLRPDTPFWALLLPAQVLLGAGFGLTLTSIVSLALEGVPPGEAGVASALTNAMREVGGAAGISVLNAIVVAATATGAGESAVTAGYATAFLGAAVLLLAALLVMLASRRQPRLAAAGGPAPTQPAHERQPLS